MEKIELKSCMIFREKGGTGFLYIESVSNRIVILTIIDRSVDYQCEEHIKNDNELQNILKDYDLLN